MGPELWVSILGILVGVLMTCVITLSTFLFKIAIKINSLEEREQNNKNDIREFKEAIKELREYLFEKKRRKQPDSDEAGTEKSREQHW